MRTAVVTATIGAQPDYLKYTIPSISGYAARIGADFVRIMSGSDYSPYHAIHANTWLFDVYDAIIMLDADILIRPECPDLTALCPEDCMGVVMEHRKDESSRAHFVVAEHLYGSLPEGAFAKWQKQYFNTGVLVLYKQHKPLFTIAAHITRQADAVAAEQTDQRTGDQALLNYRTVRDGTKLHDLGPACNHAFLASFNDYDRSKSWILHYTGNNKSRVLDDVLKMERPSCPTALYIVFGMRRSGHHAVMNWIAQQHGNIQVIEDTQLINNRLVINKPINVGANPRALIFNVEDVSPATFMRDWWPLVRERWAMKYSTIIPVVVVRDAYNWQASTYRKWLNWPKNEEWEPWRVPEAQPGRLRIWGSHIRAYMGQQIWPIGPFVGVSYNKWVEDHEYRNAIAAALRVPFTDAGFNKIAPNSGGSSFTRMSGTAADLAVNARYKQVKFPAVIANALAEDRIDEYQRSVFPDAPNRDTKEPEMTTPTVEEPVYYMPAPAPAGGPPEPFSHPAPLASPPDHAEPALNIMTICKADNWVYDRLPRFLGMIKDNCTGNVNTYLLLLVESDRISTDELDHMYTELSKRFTKVVMAEFTDPYPGQRLLYFDKLRATLLSVFELREGLYMDPDTDVVEDLQGIQAIAPWSWLLWVANPVPVKQVMDDLLQNGFRPHGLDVVEQRKPVLMEAGFIYMRKDFLAEFDRVQAAYPKLDPFMPGSTYWNMVMLALGEHATLLPDIYNTTFWDIKAAVRHAKTVHYTGQWKHLQPYIWYNRRPAELSICPEPLTWTTMEIPRP